MTSAVLAAVAAKLGRTIALAFPGPLLTLTADAAIPIDQDRTVVLSKGSAGAFTVAAPSTAAIAAGRTITLLTGTDFAHVTTFTGTTLADGTAGLNTTWTATAVSGCALTFVAVATNRWNVLSFNLGTIAP